MVNESNEEGVYVLAAVEKKCTNASALWPMMSHDDGDASRDQLDVAKLESLARDLDVPAVAPVSALLAVRQAKRSQFLRKGEGTNHQPSTLFFLDTR